MGIFDKIQDTTAAVTSSDKNTTSIGENCTIDGDITFDKTIEIHGKITGTVKTVSYTHLTLPTKRIV